MAILRIPMLILVLGLILRIFVGVRMMSENKKIVKKRNESEDMWNVEEADSHLQFIPNRKKLHGEELSNPKIGGER